jgi:hypothetical protein
LSIGRGTSGRALLKCHAGCAAEHIVAALGLTMGDLFSANGNGKRTGPSFGRMVGEYDYLDETARCSTKSFASTPRTSASASPTETEAGSGTSATRDRVLFRLPELIQADPAEPVFIVEGEKDALSLASLGLIATTNVMGAGKWRSQYSEALRSRQVVILPDNDEAGRKHGRAVADSLYGVAASIRIVELPGLPDKGDVSDWLASGETKARLLDLASKVPEWHPNSRTNTAIADLPVIIVSNRQMRDQSDDALGALKRANDPHRLFERSGQLVRVRHDENRRPMIKAVNESALRGEMERSANFRAIKNQVPLAAAILLQDLLPMGFSLLGPGQRRDLGGR